MGAVEAHGFSRANPEREATGFKPLWHGVGWDAEHADYTSDLRG